MGSLGRDLLLEAKMKGFADRQIAHMLRCLESEVHDLRVQMGIERVWKLVDTCAAEFQAQTPYYYSTFESASGRLGAVAPKNDSVSSDRKKIIVLGSGPNRIGQGIECVPNGEFCRNLGNGITGGLGGQGRGSRNPWIDFDGYYVFTLVWTNRKLHVAAAGEVADGPHHLDGHVAHALVGPV